MNGELTARETARSKLGKIVDRASVQFERFVEIIARSDGVFVGIRQPYDRVGLVGERALFAQFKSAAEISFDAQTVLVERRQAPTRLGLSFVDFPTQAVRASYDLAFVEFVESVEYLYHSSSLSYLHNLRSRDLYPIASNRQSSVIVSSPSRSAIVLATRSNLS